MFNLKEVQQKRYVVEEFRANSQAPLAGIKVGDTVLEADGMQIGDPRLTKLFFESPAGTKVTLFIRRGDERFPVEVATVESR